MDIIIDWQTFSTEFADGEISMELRPLKSYAMFMLSPYLDNPNPKLKEESVEEYTARLSGEDKARLLLNSQKIQELSSKIFPDHVRNIQGVTVNGQPLTIEQIATEVVFLQLSVEICGQLASISRLTKEDEKNSRGVLHLQDQVLSDQR